MRYEGDVNYASNPYGAPPPRQGPGKRGLFALGFAVVGIVAFAGTIIVSYRGGDHASSDGPPLLTADATPAKSRPEQPGGMEVPHQDKLVYERLHDRASGNHPTVERLLPPPEVPLPRPVVTPAMPAPAPLPNAPTVAQVPPPPPGATSTVPRDAMDATAMSAAPVQAPAAPAAASTARQAPPSVAKPPAAQPAVAQPVAPPAAKPANPVPQTAALPPPKAATPPAPINAAKPAPASVPAAAQPPAQPAKPAPAVAGGSGSWRIQLASVRSEAEAAAEWKRISGRYAEALGGLSMQVAKVDLGEKGIFYRVQGAGADEARAKSICAQLRAQNTGCVVVRP
ncbi:SPOR domain-containing protein [Azospirillum agricola]|uniref:SPOR domain-containing protein n=1 Tax=Azospirillum agricola TaxID=1720247 RepID=UPI000A0EEFDE|nr:SPOR domain-containing protein [Azospirillum agricola]SMH59321.1 Sporulation related domain-containing protein [Azospirillum lipoferum]